MRAGRVRIGISGWRYAGWRGVFYPPKLAQRRELEFAASRFSTVEINGTFYSLQKPQYFRDWSAQTPEDFVFGVKGSRYLTHMLKLRNAEKPLANFFASGLLELGKKLGPILWQFPPQLRFDSARFRGVLCKAAAHARRGGGAGERARSAAARPCRDRSCRGSAGEDCDPARDRNSR